MDELNNKSMIRFLVGNRIKFQSKCQMVSKKQTKTIHRQVDAEVKSNFLCKNWESGSSLFVCQKTITFGATLLLILMQE